MNVEFSLVDDAQAKLLMAILPFADLAGGHIEGGEQGRGPVTDVVMGIAFDIAQSHRQGRPYD